MMDGIASIHDNGPEGGKVRTIDIVIFYYYHYDLVMNSWNRSKVSGDLGL